MPFGRCTHASAVSLVCLSTAVPNGTVFEISYSADPAAHDLKGDALHALIVVCIVARSCRWIMPTHVSYWSCWTTGDCLIHNCPHCALLRAKHGLPTFDSAATQFGEGLMLSKP